MSEVDDKRAHFCSEFCRMVDALGLSDNDVAKMFQISRPTVGRWKRGESAPHWIGQPLILQALEKRMDTFKPVTPAGVFNGSLQEKKAP